MPFIGPKPADTVLDSTLIGDGTVTTAKIADSAVTSVKVADGTIVDADVGNVAATKLTGTIADARIGASSVTQHVTAFDDNKIQANIALLGFKTAVNGSLAVYNLVDQVIDEYTDATGIDASASTGESLTAGAYRGMTAITPTVTHNASSTGTDGDYTWYKYTSTGAVTLSTALDSSVVSCNLVLNKSAGISVASVLNSYV